MIRIDQAANPQPIGVPGRARRDLRLSNPVTLRNGDPTGVKRYQWTLLSRPPLSTATIVNPTSAVASITPDKHGWYRLGLAINSGQYSLGEVQTLCFAVPDTADQAKPAAGSRGSEINYDIDGAPNTEGWARERNFHQDYSLDNRHSPATMAAAAGNQYNVTLDWGLPDAVLEMLGVESVGSTNSRIEFYRDAARTEQIARVGPFDGTLFPYLFNTLTMLTGATDTLEDRKIYFTIFNDDAVDGTYNVRWRFRAP